MDNNILLARVDDAVDGCYKTDRPRFFGFLSEEEAVLVKKYLLHKNQNFDFWGGYTNAARVFLGCKPEWMDELSFPISALTFHYRTVDKLSHRDFLGALMSLGITRESVGDILIEQGRAVVFLSNDIVSFVMQNLEKIGRVGVSITYGFEKDLPSLTERKEKIVTVASMRLDTIVSACANCSRNSAVEMIESGLISVNSVVTQKTTKTLFGGDIFSVRHIGKFKILSADKKTKKDRILLEYMIY